MSRLFRVGDRVEHPKFGLGVVIDAGSRRDRSENIGVKFDNGGPQGFASNASNDIKDLRIVQ